VHDFFHVLGIPRNAPISEFRRACARRVHRAHPDFCGGGGVSHHEEARRLPIPESAGPGDAAVDFVDVATLIDRIQAGFFTSEA
jgi:hypothetical protein